ncbi:PQQ-binding-like beta-propeller repeat protein [Verrucomicrobiaceae bacterium 227]
MKLINYIFPLALTQSSIAQIEIQGKYELGASILNLEASNGQLLMNDWKRERLRKLWITPIENNPTETLEPSFTWYANPRSGFTRGEHLASAGSQLFLSNNLGDIETYTESPFQSLYLSSRLTLGNDEIEISLTDLTGSGDLLFVSNRSLLGRGPQISIFQTRPSLALEQEFLLPPTNDSQNLILWNVVASGDLLVAYPKDTRLTEEVRLFAYRRSGPSGSPWELDEEIVLPSQSDSPCFVDTDGQNIALAYSARENQVIEILSKNDENHYSSTFRTNWGDLIGETDPVANPFSGISIDGKLAVVGLIPQYGDQKSIVVALEEQGGNWIPHPPLTAPSQEPLSGLAETADGLIFAATETAVMQYSAVKEHNQRPVIVSNPITQAVAGRLYQTEIIIADDTQDLLTVTADTLPSWLSLGKKNDRWLLEGNAPADSELEETIRLRVSDPSNAETYQTFRLKTILESDLPEFLEEAEGVVISEGERLELSLEVSGAGPVTWQWYRNGREIPGADQPAISIGSIRAEENGDYQLEAKNIVGTTLSNKIEVRVEPATRFSGDWTSLGGSARRLGHSPSALDTHQFIKAWSVQTNLDGNSWNPVIADGKVFLSTRTGSPPEIRGFDLISGEPAWTADLGGVESLDPLTYHDGRIYLQGSQDRRTDLLWALDAENGGVIWEKLTADGLGPRKSPTVSEEGIWISAKEGRLHAIKGFDFDGTLKASMTTTQVQNWSPTLQKDRLYSWVQDRFSEFDTKTGNELWFLQTDSQEKAGNEMDTFVPVDGNTAILTTPRRLICIDLQYRVEKWRTTESLVSEYGAVPSGPPSIHRDRVFAIFGKQILSFDINTGEPSDVFDFENPIISDQPLITNDHLIAATSEETRIYSLDSGQLLQTLPSGGLLGFSNGYLMISSEDGQLHAYFANDTPDLLTETLPDAIEDIDYDFALSVSHGDSDETLTFRKISGPAWLEVSATGQFSGSFGNVPLISENLVIEVSDGVTPPLERSFPLTMIAVNDPPEASTPIENIIANPAANATTLDITASFSDPDLIDTLMYSLSANSNPAIFSHLMVGATDGRLSMEFAPYQSGSSEVTLRATDLEGLFAEQTFTVTLPDLPIPTFAQNGEVTLNRQTGLFEQKITVTNSAARAIGGFTLTTTLPNDVFKLYNVDGNTLTHGIPLEAGASVEFTLEYFSGTSRTAPDPEIALALIQPDPQTIEIVSATELDRILPLADKSVLLEFASIPGTRYAIQYSHDMVTWFSSPTVIKATANRTQWLDQGLPRTNCHPAECPIRAYRLLTLPVAQ